MSVAPALVHLIAKFARIAVQGTTLLAERKRIRPMPLVTWRLRLFDLFMSLPLLGVQTVYRTKIWDMCASSRSSLLPFQVFVRGLVRDWTDINLLVSAIH